MKGVCSFWPRALMMWGTACDSHCVACGPAAWDVLACAALQGAVEGAEAATAAAASGAARLQRAPCGLSCVMHLCVESVCKARVEHTVEKLASVRCSNGWKSQDMDSVIYCLPCTGDVSRANGPWGIRIDPNVLVKPKCLHAAERSGFKFDNRNQMRFVSAMQCYLRMTVPRCLIPFVT